MQLLTITNLTSQDIVLKAPVYELSAYETKTAVAISIEEVEALSADLTRLSTAGTLSYNVYTDTTKDTDTQFATIHDVEAALPTVAHHLRHENGGADEISVTGLSGLLADGQTPLAHKTSHQNGGTDELSVAGLSGLLADAQTPAAHKTSHENGGADEISVLGLNGLLADGQTPLAHKTSHENGGADELSVAGLSGLLADAQTPAVHATAHQSGGTDATNRISLVFGCSGTPVTAQYVNPGFSATNATEIKVTVPVACTITEVRVFCGTAPGGVVVDTYTVRVNGVNSAAAPTVTGAAVTGTWTGTVAVTADDEISVLSTIGGGSATANVTVCIYGE